MRNSFTIALAVFAGVAHAQTSFVVKVVDEARRPVSRAVVTWDSVSRFTSEEGILRLTATPGGSHRLIVKRIGLAPFDTTIAQPTDSVRVVMRRLTFTLPAVRVRNDDCKGQAADVSDGLRLLFDRVTENAERYRLLARDYPFQTAMQRQYGARRGDDWKIDRPVVDTVSFASRTASQYSPGNVLSPMALRGVTVRDYMTIPDLTDLADSAFMRSHCFRFAGFDTVASAEVVRMEFEPVSSLKGPDVAGTIRLRTSDYQLVQLQFRLVNLPPRSDVESVNVTTDFREIAPGLVIIGHVDSRIRWATNVGTAVVRRAPRTGEIQEMVGLQWQGSGLWKADSVTVRGIVFDSLHGRPLASALVGIGAKSGITDSAGRFTIEGVVPGNYRVTAQHDAVDQLGLSAIGANVRVVDGSDPIVVPLPSFAGLWRLMCGQTTEPGDKGLVFGSVRATTTIRYANVAVSWIDVSVSQTRVAQDTRSITVAADSIGNYAVCGVPTTTGLSIRAVADSGESGEFSIAPLDRERIARRDLSIAAQGRKAIISGKVLGDSGRALLDNADVTDLGGGQTVSTNARGEYALKDLAAGSHRLLVRKIGYAEMEVSVDVEDGGRRERDIVMTKVTVLDSVAVTAKALPRDEALRSFEEHRKLGLGKFMTIEELEKKRGNKLSTLLMQWPGLVVPTRNPRDNWPMPNRGPKSFDGGCDVTVFLDGVRLDPKVDRDLDRLAPPDMLAGIEWYPGGASIPPEYVRLNAHCGVLVLHSRYKAGKP